MRILIFGDSITQGFYDSHGGWAARLAGTTNRHGSHDPKDRTLVFPLGIADDKVSDIITRLPVETEARLNDDDSCLMILAVGINDSALLDNRVVLDEQDFIREYNKLIDIAQDYTPLLLLVGLTAVDESIVDDWAPKRNGKTWANNRVNLFEDCIKQIAFEKQLPFLPVHDSFIKQLQGGKHLLSDDGIHPNDVGHEFVLERVKEALKELLA